MGTASGGDVSMAAAEISAAVDECCMMFETHRMNVGTGLEALATTWQNCWTAQNTFNTNAMNGGTVTAPEIPGPPDAMGNPTVAVPAKEVNAGSNWASLAAAQWAHQCQAQIYATQTYNQQYNAWLEAYESYQQAQVVPQLVAFGLQVAALVKMYDEWTKYLSKTNTIMCGLADTVYPCVEGRYLETKNDIDNHILDMQSGIDIAGDAAIQAEKAAWHCELGTTLLDCWQNDGEGQAGFKTLIGQHTQNMAQHLSNLCEAGQWAIQDAKTCVTDFKAAVDSSFTQWGEDNYDGVTAEVEQLYSKAADICSWLNQCGMEMADNYTGSKSPLIQSILEDQVADAGSCLVDIQNAIGDADECMQIQKDLYESYREPLQTYFAAEVINEVNNMLLSGTLIQDCQAFAEQCSREFKDKYNLLYEPCEDELAKKILNMACRLAEGTEDCHEFQKDLSMVCIEHWQDHYENCDGILGEGIMQEAKLLYDTRKETFDTFVENHGKLWDFWCDHYQNLENDFSFQLITKATEQVCEWKLALDKLCEEACGFLEWWRDCYSAAECVTAPKIINAGVTACEQQIDTYQKLDDILDDLCRKWFDEVCRCEILDIQELCKLHDKAEVVCEIDDNSQCVQEIADQLKDCYLRVGLQCEKEYLQELCDMEKYEPEFCNLEDRALLHIRSRFDKARENLLRNSNRYCVGNTDYQLCKLETEQARLEAQAIESANRFERWWAVRECDRRHRYKTDMIQVYQGFAAMAIEGFSNSTQQYDAVLTQIHNRLSRSYNMLSQANQAGSTVSSSTAAAVNQALSGIQAGQFYPDLYFRMKSEFNSSSNNMAARAQEQTRIGQQYSNLALDALQRAENTASTSVQQGQQAMEHGFRYKQMALQASQAADKTALDAQNLGLAWIDRGHRQIEFSQGWKDREWRVICEGIEKAQRQVDQAQSTLAQAFAFEQHRDGLIQQCRNNGMDSARHQFEIFNAGVGKVERAMQSSENGLRTAFELINWGQQQRASAHSMMYNMGTLVAPSVSAYNGLVGQGMSMLGMATQNTQIGMQAKGQQIAELCRAIQQRDALVCQKLLGMNAVGNSTFSIASMFGQGVTSSAEGLIGSISGFVGSPPSILQGAPGPGGTQNTAVGGGSPINPIGSGPFSGVGLPTGLTFTGN